MRHIYGLRTFIACLVAIVALVVGLWLLEAPHRAGAYLVFGGSIVGALGVLGTKSTLTAAAGGDGLVKAFQNIASTSKPGEPPVTP